VETALRLLACVISAYPRAFDLVLADALYAEAPFFNFLLAHGKHALVVLKDENLSAFQRYRRHSGFRPQREAAHFCSGGGEIVAGVVLGQVGQHQLLGTGRPGRFWQRWFEEPTFSADTLGRVHAVFDANGLRQGIHDVYERLKRNKALPDIYGLGVVVLDGHESHAS
jgi:hypothetical protein